MDLLWPVGLIFGYRTVAWLSSFLLLVRATEQKPCCFVASVPASSQSTFWGVRASKETWLIHRSNAPPLSCGSAWNRRTPSISAPELLGVEGSRPQDLKAVSKWRACVQAPKNTACATTRKREKLQKQIFTKRVSFFTKNFLEYCSGHGRGLLKTKVLL